MDRKLMLTWIGLPGMLLCQFVVMLAVHWLWHDIVPERFFEDHIISESAVHSAADNPEMIEQVIGEVRDQVATLFSFVAVIAAMMGIAWYAIVQLSPIQGPSFVSAFRGQWFILAGLGAAAAALITWARLPIEVGSFGRIGLPAVGVLIYVTLYYLVGTLLWTPRPLRSVVPGASGFSLV